MARNGLLAAVAVCCLLATSGPAVAQSDGVTFTTTAGDPAAGGDVTVTFTLENTDNETATAIINVTELPEGWTITDRTDDGGTWNGDDRKWLYTILEPGSSVSPTLTLSGPADATGSYNISATGADSDRTVASTATVTVGATSEPSTETNTASTATAGNGDMTRSTSETSATDAATSSGSGDGLGVAVTGLAVLCGSLLARRRL